MPGAIDEKSRRAELRAGVALAGGGDSAPVASSRPLLWAELEDLFINYEADFAAAYPDPARLASYYAPTYCKEIDFCTKNPENKWREEFDVGQAVKSLNRPPTEQSFFNFCSWSLS